MNSPVSYSINFHSVDVNIITFHLASMWPILKIFFFIPSTNNKLVTSLLLTSRSTLPIHITFADEPRRDKFVLISRHVMRETTINVPLFFFFKFTYRNATPYLFFFFFLNMRSVGGSNFLVSLRVLLFLWVHCLVPTFFCYMSKLVTCVTPYMSRKRRKRIIILLLHISLIAINSFVTK